MRLIHASLCLSILLLGARASEAKTYYLATTGLDTNDGSAAKPWKTFAATSTKLLPGDILEVAAGSYPEQVVLGQMGLSGSPVTVRAAPGAKVVIAGGGTLPAQADEGLLQIVGSYIVVEGLEVTGSKFHGVYLSGTGNTLTKCKVHDNQQFGVHLFQTKSATVSLNEIYQNVLANKAHTASQHETGLELYLAENSTVSGNIVYHNHGEGIVISLGKNNLVRGNRVYDNLENELFVNNTEAARVDGNFIYCTAGSGFEVGGKRPNGVAIGDTPYPGSAGGTGNELVNNIVSGCNLNLLWFVTSHPGTGLKNALIAHNTLVQAVDTGLQLAQGAHQGSTIANNIIVQSNGLMINLNTTLTGLTFSHNNWLGGPAGQAASATDIVGNCDLADLASLDPSGFKLGANAPCKDKGLALPKVKTDFFGTPRPVGAGYAVGAHEAAGAVSVDGGVKDGPLPAGDSKLPPDGKLLSDAKLPAGDGAKKPDGGAGDGVARADAGAAVPGEAGCGCRVGGAAPRAAGLGLLALSLLVILCRRRRR